MHGKGPLVVVVVVVVIVSIVVVVVDNDDGTDSSPLQLTREPVSVQPSPQEC